MEKKLKNTKKHRRQKNNKPYKAHTSTIMKSVMVLVGVIFLGFVLAGTITVTLSSNQLNMTNSSAQEILSCSGSTDANNIENISLYTNVSGDFLLNDTHQLFDSDTLVSYYRLNDNNLNDSMNLYNGTNTGTTNISGIINSARYFDGTDIINFTNKSYTDEVAISVWFMINNSGTSACAGDGCTIYFSGGNTINEHLEVVGTEIRYGFASESASNNLFTTSGASIQNDTWYHVIANGTGDGAQGSYQIYLDGVNQTVTFSGVGANRTRPSDYGLSHEFHFGSWIGNKWFTGVVDEVALYNRTLTTQDVEELYNNGNASLPLSPNFNYNFTQITTWNCYICDDEGDCSFATANRTEPFVFENQITYNSSTYETDYETFVLNVTSNDSLTGVTLDYNGSEIPATLSNGNWTVTRSILNSDIGTNQLRWIFDYAGGVIYSNNFTQTVSDIQFGFCNGSLTDDFINISFANETDSAIMNASIPSSTWVYYLGNGTTNETYTFTNTSDNWNYTFCATPANRTLNILPYVQYRQGTDYPQRVWNPTVTSYTNSSVNQTLYLLSSTEGIYVTIQVQTVGQQAIEGVLITVNRTIDGTSSIVGSGITGNDGSVTFWLNPDFIHDFLIEANGYTDYETSFAPTQTSYTITLGGESAYEDSYWRGINYNLYPSNRTLVNDTIYAFGMNLTSNYFDLQEYGFDLRLRNGTIIDGSSTAVNGTTITINYNTTNQSVIYMDYYWLINDTYTNITREWKVYNIDNTQWSLGTWRDDLVSYMDTELFGLDNFGRYLIIFLVIFLTIGIMSYKYGFTSPVMVLFIIFIIIFTLDVVFELIPTISVLGGTEFPYILTMISGLILVIYLLKEVGK